MKHRPQVILFLDIDGVMHSASNQIDGPVVAAEQKRVDIVRGRLNPASLGLLDQDKQRLLADVLARHPLVKIVISSAWRTWEGYNFLTDEAMDPVFEATHVKTLQWLKDWLLPDISERISGATPLGESRLEEIEAVMQAMGPDACWVALDDQADHFPADAIPHFYQEEQGERYNYGVSGNRVVVLINGEAGLSLSSAAALDAALSHASDSLAASAVAKAA